MSKDFIRDQEMVLYRWKEYFEVMTEENRRVIREDGEQNEGIVLDIYKKGWHTQLRKWKIRRQLCRIYNKSRTLHEPRS